MYEAMDWSDIKRRIETVNLDIIQNYMLELLDPDTNLGIGLDYIFQKVYLHACLKGRADLAEWLQTDFFPKMNPIEQIAIRQVFPYGRYLLMKSNVRVHD